jgi:hypothetical protein
VASSREACGTPEQEGGSATAQREYRHFRSVPRCVLPREMPWILGTVQRASYGSAPTAFTPHHSRTADTRDLYAYEAVEAWAPAIRPLASVLQPAVWVLVSGSDSSLQLSFCPACAGARPSCYPYRQLVQARAPYGLLNESHRHGTVGRDGPGNPADLQRFPADAQLTPGTGAILTSPNPRVAPWSCCGRGPRACGVRQEDLGFSRDSA